MKFHAYLMSTLCTIEDFQMYCVFVVSEVVQTLQLYGDKEQSEVVGEMSVCLDGLTVDPEMFASAEADHYSE